MIIYEEMKVLDTKRWLFTLMWMVFLIEQLHPMRVLFVSSGDVFKGIHDLKYRRLKPGRTVIKVFKRAFQNILEETHQIADSSKYSELVESRYLKAGVLFSVEGV